MSGPGDLATVSVPTPVKTSAYTAAPGDFVRTDATAGSVTVTLPLAPPANTTVAVKMMATSGSSTTSIACSGSDLINRPGGGTALTLTLAGQGAVLQYDSGLWLVRSDDLPLAQLDARYSAAGAPTLDSTATDIQPLGTQAAGAVGMASTGPR